MCAVPRVWLGVCDMIRQDPSGWWFAKDDSYFPRFVAGPAPKKNGFMREHLLEAFKHVRAWDFAVDVGSHVGFWAWDMAQRFKQVVCFEPVKANYECLVKNVAEFDNLKLHNVAVGDVAATCTVHADRQRPGNSGSYYVMPDATGSVDMVTLNQMALPGCDLLKIDVEGFELNVLKGATEVLQTYRPVIIMECTDRKFRGRYEIPEGAAQRWLQKRGYREVAAMRPDKVFIPSWARK